MTVGGSLAPPGCKKSNPFLDLPGGSGAVTYRRGWLARKVLAEADGKKSEWGGTWGGGGFGVFWGRFGGCWDWGGVSDLGWGGGRFGVCWDPRGILGLGGADLGALSLSWGPEG